MYVFRVELLNGDSCSATLHVVASTSKAAGELAVCEHNKSKYQPTDKMTEYCIAAIERGPLVWGIER